MEFYRDRKKDLNMVFIHQKKAYDRVPSEVLWECLERTNVSIAYVRVIKNMHEGVRTRVRTLRRDSNNFSLYDFSINTGLHQG